MFLIVAADGRGIGRAAIDRDLLRHAVAPDRLFQKAQRRRLISVLCEEKVNGLPGLIHGAIEVVPLAFDLDVGLVHTPADPHRPLAPVERRFQLGTISRPSVG